MTTQWAIKIPLSEKKDDWLYLTEITEGMDYNTPVVKTFNTKEEAKQHALIWGTKVEIVKYGKSSS
jgi:hypothetical protein